MCGVMGLVASFDVVIESNVRVRVDDARGKVLSSSINDGGARGRVHILADGGDLAVLDIDRAIRDVAVRHRHHGGVPDHNVVMTGRRGLREGGRGQRHR